MDNIIALNKSWFIDQLNLYQAANSDHEAIKSNFKIRLEEFQSIVDALLNKGKNDPLQHELILGRRGSGKSTLLKRIEIEILENEKLNKYFIPVNLAEEQAGIYRLFDLWEQVINELNCQYDAGIEVPEYSTFSDNNAYCRQLYQLIHKYCKDAGKRLVLLLDNFDRIVENLDDDGNLLREILINYNDIAIIGASTRMDEHFWHYDMPFFDFLRYHRIEALSRKELNFLLTHWGEILEIQRIKTFLVKNPGKVENVRLLTDGLPRTLQFFMQMVMHDNHLQGYDYLKKIMDHATPLYQERLRHLTPQFRKIVIEMAFIWEACSTKELVRACRMESKLVSANLNTLFEKGIVEKIEMNKRNHLYRISERFFNLWLIITQGNPEQKRRARWLSIFIENWYDAVEIKMMAQKHLEQLKSEGLKPKDAIIMSKALSQSRYITTGIRDEIIKHTESLLEKSPEKPFIELPGYTTELIDEIYKCIKNGHFKKALQIAESIENEEDGVKFGIIGYIHHINSQFSLAEKYYLLAHKKGAFKAYGSMESLAMEPENHEISKRHYRINVETGTFKASYNLAHLYHKKGKLEEAEKYYLLAIEMGIFNALLNLANLYRELGKIKQAEKYYLMAIEKDINEALFNLANLYQEQERLKEAEKYYHMAIEKGVDIAINDLVTLYYASNQKNNTALQLARQHTKLFSNTTLLILEVWNGIFEDVENRIQAMFKQSLEGRERFITELLIHQQKQLVLKLFNHPEFGEELRNRYQLLYYAAMLLVHTKAEDIKLRIPPEIKQTVNEMIESIREREKFYGYS